MQLAKVFLSVVALLLLTVACNSSTPVVRSSPVTFSPLPSAATLLKAKLVMADQAWRIRGGLLVKGKGFDVHGVTKVWVMQGGQAYELGTVSVKADGSFSAQLGLPNTLEQGTASLAVCSYAVDSQNPIGCVTRTVSLLS